MILETSTAIEIDQVLRGTGGESLQRDLQVEMMLATATGQMIHACIRDFTRGGITFAAHWMVAPATRFGFELPEVGKTHLLFCHTLSCRPDGPEFLVSASFLAHEIVRHHRLRELF